MNVVVQIFAMLAGLLHVLFFALESLMFRHPKVHGIFRVRAEDVPKVRLWAFNQGFYNLFLAAGAIGGVVALHTGDETVGKTLILFTCGSMLLASIVLFVSDPRVARLRAVAVQGLAPLVVLLAASV